jgi:hypothetical protein
MVLTNFMPATGVGRFDADLQGDELQIIHKFLLVNDTTKPLTDGDYEQYKVRFKQLVREHWQDKYGFQRGTRVVRPKFKLKFLDDDAGAASAHYVVNLRDGRGGSENVSRKPAMRFKNLADSGLYFPASSSLFSGSIQNPGSHVLIASDLPTMFPFYLDAVGGALTSQTQKLLKQYLGQVAKLNAAARVEVTGYGQGSGLVQTVLGLLRGVGLTNASARMSKKWLQPKFWGKTSTSKWSGHSDYLKVSLGTDLGANLFQNSNLFTYPAAIVHEYGHMLGLQDEYACLATTAAQRLVDLNFIDTTEKAAYEANHAQGARTDSDEAQAGQVAFVELCHAAGVEPAHFGRQTTSIMSAGNEYQPCH